MKHAILMCAGLALASCGEPAVNAPTDPAEPIATPDQPVEAPKPGITPTVPGIGPTSFVGRWAAQPSWCGNTTGERQPIVITPTRFEGYENGCDITRVGEVQGGYIAYLSCEAEGVSSAERLRLSTTGQTLALTWLDRANMQVELVRCPAMPAPTPAPRPIVR